MCNKRISPFAVSRIKLTMEVSWLIRFWTLVFISMCPLFASTSRVSKNILLSRLLASGVPATTFSIEPTCVESMCNCENFFVKATVSCTTRAYSDRSHTKICPSTVGCIWRACNRLCTPRPGTNIGEGWIHFCVWKFYCYFCILCGGNPPQKLT